MSVGACRLCTTAEMRQLERAAAAAGVSEPELMEQAGAAIFRELSSAAGSLQGKRALVLVGPGNNGGDGLVIARHLAAAGVEVAVLLAKERAGDRNLQLAISAGAKASVHHDGVARRLAEGADILVDCLLGIGSSPPLRGTIANILAEIREMAGPLRIACDIPSGVQADTGQADPAAFRADLTVAAGPVKAGLLLFPAHGFCGKIVQTDIGLPASALAGLQGQALVPEAAAADLPSRPVEGHKGTYGKALIIGGSRGYRGAAALACMGALRAGAGLVTLASIEPVIAAAAARFSSATFEALEEAGGAIAPAAAKQAVALLAAADGAALGPGLGPHAAGFVRAVLESAPARTDIVLDADGLNAVAPAGPAIRDCKAQLILTPHPGEMGRLLSKSAEAVQSDRLGAALAAARATGHVVVLKGAGTIVAEPDGAYAIAPFAVPALASAGTGDVLAGIVTALLAQGLAVGPAARLGVLIHALAGDALGRRLGPAGATADDLPLEIPGVIERLCALRTGE